MTALTRLIDAFNAALAGGLGHEDAMVEAQVGCHIRGDNFINLARNCFPKEG